MTVKHDKQRDARMLRWGIVLGGLLSNNGGYIQEASELLQADDASNETTCKLLAGVFSKNSDKVRYEVSILIGDELLDTETALGGVLRKVYEEAVGATAAKAQSHLRHAKVFDSPEAWVEYVEQQVGPVKRRLNASDQQETPTTTPQS